MHGSRPAVGCFLRREDIDRQLVDGGTGLLEERHMAAAEGQGMAAVGLQEVAPGLVLQRDIVLEGGSRPPEEGIGLAAYNILVEDIAPEEVLDLVALGDIVLEPLEEGVGRKVGNHSQAAAPAAVAAVAADEEPLSGCYRRRVSE